MKIGVVEEIKPDERRVALTPAGALALIADGHDVAVQAGAGLGSGFADGEYEAVGANVVSSAAQVWQHGELLLKVKEPIEPEYRHLRREQTLFTYLHLAADRPLTRALVEARTTAIGYETIEDDHGQLPLLAPMSEIAGRLAGQAGAWYLHAPHGGAGLLAGGAPGVERARALVIGGGAVGSNAAAVAAGMGAEVTILERSLSRIRELEERFGPAARVLVSDPLTLHAELERAHIVIGAVLVPGALAPSVITHEDLHRMAPGSVIVDVAIDQGGCVQTSRPTTHADPVYTVEEIVHYCVANMPGAVPVTSTRALTNATIPYVRALARDRDTALANDPGFAAGVNTHEGQITNAAVAAAFASQLRAA